MELLKLPNSPFICEKTEVWPRQNQSRRRHLASVPRTRFSQNTNMSESHSSNGFEQQNGHNTDESGATLVGRHLQKTYGRRRVVDDVSISVSRGEVVGLLGANGAGKTTTFYMIVGLEPTEKGEISLNGKDVTS